MRLIFYAVCLFHCLFLHADEDIPSVIMLPAGQVYNGNYFAFGSTIEISGVVNGDVYLCGEQIIIDGVVNGDVLACGGSIDISGVVANNVRVIAGQLLVNGSVGKNITVLAGNAQLQPASSIGDSIVAIAGNIELSSSVGTSATVLASNARISSEIKQGLLGYFGQMRITSHANIGGNVDYRSNVPAWIDPCAVIGGEVNYHPSFVHGLIKGTWIQGLLVGSKVIALLMNFLYTLAIGIILLRYFRKNLDAALMSLHQTPLRALFCGLVLLIALPLISLILLMTILGVPFALTLIALNIMGLYTAKIYSIFWASNRFFGKFLKPNQVPILCLGLLVYFALSLIPVVGIIVAFVAMLFGLGAGVIAQTKSSLLKTRGR